MTTTDLTPARLRELLDAATPGAWHVDGLHTSAVIAQVAPHIWKRVAETDTPPPAHIMRAPPQEQQMSDGRSDLIDVAVKLHAETERAWLVSDTGERKDAKWIPKSQAELAAGLLTLPEWLAKEKELI